MYVALGLIGTLNIVFRDLNTASDLAIVGCIALYGAITFYIYSKINIGLK